MILENCVQHDFRKMNIAQYKQFPQKEKNCEISLQQYKKSYKNPKQSSFYDSNIVLQILIYR